MEENKVVVFVDFRLGLNRFTLVQFSVYTMTYDHDRMTWETATFYDWFKHIYCFCLKYAHVFFRSAYRDGSFRDRNVPIRAGTQAVVFEKGYRKTGVKKTSSVCHRSTWKWRQTSATARKLTVDWLLQRRAVRCVAAVYCGIYRSRQDKWRRLKNSCSAIVGFNWCAYLFYLRRTLALNVMRWVSKKNLAETFF